jgi:hypothetical protein
LSILSFFLQDFFFKIFRLFISAIYKRKGIKKILYFIFCRPPPQQGGVLYPANALTGCFRAPGGAAAGPGESYRLLMGPLVPAAAAAVIVLQFLMLTPLNTCAMARWFQDLNQDPANILYLF